MISNSKTDLKRKLPTEDETDRQIWINIRQQIDQLYANVFFMPGRYELDLYGLIYNCFSTISSSSKRHCTENNDVQQQYASISDELRKILFDFFNMYLTIVEKEGVDLVGEDVLRFYVRQWDDFLVLSKELELICSYLTTYWIKMEKFELTVLAIRQMTTQIWNSHVKLRLYSQIRDAILTLIKSERNGGTIKTDLISKVVKSLVLLNIFLGRDYTLRLYKELIEIPFLEETKQFYIKESNQFLSQNSVSQYLRWVEIVLLREEIRVKSYLEGNTLDVLLKTCCEVLIKMHLDTLKAHFTIFLKENKTEDLNRLFRLIYPIPNSLTELFSIVESHVQEQGISAIEKCGKIISSDPKMYIETILCVRDECFSMVSTAFDKCPGFLQACAKGCRKFINKNLVTQLENSTSSKPAELLARYCDLLLKKNPDDSSTIDVEDYLDNVIAVFKYINDKDVFQALYTRLLAKRLITQSSSSIHAEESMIRKLKLACGNDYASRLQRMFNDVMLSNDLNVAIQTLFSISDEPAEFDFGVCVLNSRTWSFQQSCSLLLPVELERNMQRFMKVYSCLCNKRILQWHYQLSRGELVTNCFQNRHILQVSTLQMAVLLQFNASDEFTVQELQENTQMQMEYLTQVLQILLKAKLLTSDSKEDEDLQASSIVRIFLGYKTTKQRVNLNIPLTIEIKREKEATAQAVNDKRKTLLQATIVRVMKTRKQIDNQQLLTEVIGQLSKQFKPTVGFIMKCIDTLIEKRYFKRDERQPDLYIYLA